MVNYTIICSTRNRPETLQKSLLLTRKVLPSEIPIIVFDDASDDPSAVEVALASIENVRVLRSEHQIGPGAGRNRCMEAATTEFCFSLDDDCYLAEAPDISRWLENDDETQDIAVVGFRCYNTAERFYGPEHDIEGPSNIILGGASLLRKSAVLSAGGYLEWLVFASEDSELAGRLCQLGYRIWYDPSVLVMHDHVPFARDQRWESFYYVRNAYLIRILHLGFVSGFLIGIFSALRRGIFHSTMPGQIPRALATALKLTPFCLRERKRLFNLERRCVVKQSRM